MPSDWTRVKEIFGDALELPPNERTAFVEQACAGDAELRAAVEQLLANSDNTQTVDLLPRAVTHFAAGTLITPRFRIVRFLGQGGMGEVYEAQDLELGGSVALKTLRPALRDDAQFLARFRREAQLARQVTHPGVCRIFDIGSADVEGTTVVFLTMELLEGETLGKRLRRQGPFTEAAALPLLRNILEALGALHEHGIIHRDMKPGNVMVVPSRSGAERAVITDFGLARDLSAGAGQTVASNLMGTPAYMAPEQFQGEPATPQSDIYALGIVMHELLTNRTPFAAARAATAPQAAPPSAATVTQSEPLSPPLQALIRRCLSSDPAERPQSTGEVLELLNGSGLTPRKAAPAASRRKTLAAASALLLTAAGAGTWYLRKPSTEPGAAPAEKRLVAIIPFNAGDAELRAFSDGLAEMLTSKLTELEQLQGGTFSVVPASEIRNRKIDSVDSARKQYGVALAITGSIQRLGKSLQFTANLVDAAQLRQLRATSFDAGADDMRSLRDGVISRVTGMLDVQRTPQVEKALDAKETDRAAAYFAYLEGRGYLYRFDVAGNVDRAIQSLDKAVREDPNYALAHAALGEAYWRKARNLNDKAWGDKALASARKAVQLGGALAVPHIRLGDIYLQGGQQQEAIQEFQLALRTEPGNSEAYRGLGNVYSAIGLLKEAEDAYLRAVDLRPNDWYAHNLLGLFYFRQGIDEKAERAWIKARELTPDNEYPYRNLGWLYVASGRFDQAKREFERSNAIKPSFLASLGLGRLLYYAGHPSEAVQEFEKATKVEPFNHFAWGGLGDAYSQIPGKSAAGDAAYLAAIESCERHLALSPKADEARAYLALYHARLKHKAKALEIIAQVNEAPVLTIAIEARIAIAAAYEVLGERRMAIKGFESLPGVRAATVIRADPLLRALTLDPAFQASLAR